LKGILPAKQNFVGGGMFFYFQIGLLNWVKETHVSLKKSICVRSRSI
jgi:hypothetical protein